MKKKPEVIYSMDNSFEIDAQSEMQYKENRVMRENRMRYGITLKDMSDKTFIPEKTLWEWEKGISNPHDRAAAGRVADMIKCSVSEIFESL